MADIARQTKTAVVWRFTSTGVSGVVELGTGIVLARLLMPEHFGIVALALIVIGFARNLSEFGLGAAIVQRRQVEQRHLTAAFWGSAAIGLILAGALCLVASPAARFFGEPAVNPVMRLLSITMIVGSLSAVPRALLHRALDFRKLFWADLVGRIAYGAIGIPLAVVGFNFWSLVWASLGGEVFALAALVVATGYVPSLRFRLSGLIDLVRFGGGVTAVGLLNYTAGNVDYFIIGRWLSPAALGLYRKAYILGTYPPAKLSMPLYQVLFPAFSRLQSEPSRVKYAYGRALTGIGIVTFPLLTGLAVTAPLLIPTVLGTQWREAVLPTQIMCLAGLLRVLANPAGALVKGMGHVMAEVWRQLLYLLIIGGGCLLAVHWGISALAVVVVVGSATLAITLAQYVHKLVHFGLTDYLRALRVPLLGCAVLAPVAALALKLGGMWMGDGGTLLVTILTCGIPYCLVVWFVPFSEGRQIIRDFAQLIRSKYAAVPEKPITGTVANTVK